MKAFKTKWAFGFYIVFAIDKERDIFYPLPSISCGIK
jgi:hypothetical protein